MKINKYQPFFLHQCNNETAGTVGTDGTILMVMTEIPFNLKGRIFRSAMPFGTYDPEGEVLGEYFENGISVVVPLASVEECIEKAGRDLHLLYKEKGFEVVSLPVEDYAAPGREALADVIDKVIRLAGSGRNVPPGSNLYCRHYLLVMTTQK